MSDPQYPSSKSGAASSHQKILLTESEAAEAIGLTRRFLQNRRNRGDGPPYVRISSRCIRYEPHVLRAWAAAHRRTSSDTDSDQE